MIGIEDDRDEPSAGQRVPMELPDILRRKLAGRTVNVSVLPDVVTALNGGQYIDQLHQEGARSGTRCRFPKFGSNPRLSILSEPRGRAKFPQKHR
ncbi:MAG: hypothetical protein LBK99_08850 [Opitutaceae bacterium]|nr:hypothetical protein [Opitutaceae bacterium]